MERPERERGGASQITRNQSVPQPQSLAAQLTTPTPRRGQFGVRRRLHSEPGQPLTTLPTLPLGVRVERGDPARVLAATRRASFAARRGLEPETPTREPGLA